MGSQREQMNGTTNLKQSTIANRVCDNLEILRISSESPQTKVLLNKAHNGNLNGGTESKDQNRNRQEKQIAGRPQTKPKVTTDGTAMGSVTAGSNGVPQDLAVHILAPGSFDDDACDVADMNGISANKTVDNANAEAPNLASSSVLELPQSPKGGKETRAPKRSRLSHREEASNLSSSSILPQSPKVEKETRAPKRSRLSHREEASNIPSSSILPQSPKVEKEMQAPEGQLLACREDALTIAGNDVDPATARTINPQSPQPTPNVVSEAPTGSRFADAHQVTGEPTVEIPEVKKESRMFWRGSNHVLNRCIMRVKDKIPSRKIRESSANVALVGFGSRTSTANDKIPSGRIREGSTDVAFVELDGLKLVKDAYPSAKDCINFEQSISERLECLISTITFDGPEAESSTIEELQMILDKSGKVTPCIVISCASQHRALDIKKCLKERLELFDLYDLPWEVICDPKRVGFLALLAASTGEHFPIGKHGYSARTPSNNGNFWDKYAAAPLYLVPEPTEGKLRDQNSDCLASCTLGGFIEVANSIYGLTVAHPLFNAIAMNPTRMPEDGKAMTLNVGNIIACVLSNVSSNNTTATEMQDPVPPNSDWALIELGEDFDRAKWDHSWTAAYSSPIPQEKLEIQEDADLEPREVLIRAGFSGNVKGKLRIARSRLQIGSSRFSAMSIELEEHSSLTRGDSGSFVILDGSICGTIIAGRDSLNLAYMLPIADTFHSIATEYGGVSVRFPSVGTRQQVQPTSSRPVESTPFGQDAPAKGKRPPFKDISTINELEIGKLEIPDPPTKSPSGPEAPLNKTGIWQKGRKCQACRNSEKLASGPSFHEKF
ncbi:hypothetical protein N431DRAFT_552134 [Stipitochalara longipes BDJ]|nr:hypothetical protein N431DRAFT_552134 [Stipitochalara longipes BDJ]